MKSILFLIFTVCLSAMVSGQQKKTTDTWQFHSILNAGLLEGQKGSAFQLQSVNGMQYKSWFAGIGVGLDYYRYRTIPLFLDIRKEFGSTVNKFFAYADGGINFWWLTDMQTNTADGFHNGFYTDLGMGYKIRLGKSNHLLLAMGYSLKKLSETYQSSYYDPPDFLLTENRINYNLNRITLKIGWEF